MNKKDLNSSIDISKLQNIDSVSLNYKNKKKKLLNNKDNDKNDESKYKCKGKNKYKSKEYNYAPMNDEFDNIMGDLSINFSLLSKDSSNSKTEDSNKIDELEQLDEMKEGEKSINASIDNVQNQSRNKNFNEILENNNNPKDLDLNEQKEKKEENNKSLISGKSKKIKRKYNAKNTGFYEIFSEENTINFTLEMLKQYYKDSSYYKKSRSANTTSFLIFFEDDNKFTKLNKIRENIKETYKHINSDKPFKIIHDNSDKLTILYYTQFNKPTRISKEKILNAGIVNFNVSSTTIINTLSKIAIPLKGDGEMKRKGQNSIAEIEKMGKDKRKYLQCQLYNIVQKINDIEDTILNKDNNFKEMKVFYIYGEGDDDMSDLIYGYLHSKNLSYNDIYFRNSFWNGVNPDNLNTFNFFMTIFF